MLLKIIQIGTWQIIFFDFKELYKYILNCTLQLVFLIPMACSFKKNYTSDYTKKTSMNPQKEMFPRLHSMVTIHPT